jgi:outer membrane immunogenic protein
MKMLAAQVTAISLLCAGAASAADMRMPVKAPAPAPVASYNWTGCYLGGGGGYGMYDQDTQLFGAGGAPTNNSLDQGGRGWFATVQVGCDIQIGGSFVIGAFADYDWSRIRGNHTGGDGSVGLQSGRVKLDNSWAAGGRIGYLVTPSLLAFFSAGYTQAEFTGTTFFFPGGAADNSATPGATFSGYFIGGGTEYALSWLPFRGLFWKSEYRFADYGSKTLTQFIPATGAANGFTERNHSYVQTIRTELVWRFNFGGGGGAF